MKYVGLIIAITLTLWCGAAYVILDRNTKEAENRSRAAAIRAFVERYFEKYGNYPKNIAQLEQSDRDFQRGYVATFEVKGSPPNELITITFPSNGQKVVLPIRRRSGP